MVIKGMVIMLVIHYLSCAITFLLVFYLLWVLVDIPLKHFCKGLLKPVYRNLIGITVSPKTRGRKPLPSDMGRKLAPH